jgi:branched-chain amino acid aminotransferase
MNNLVNYNGKFVAADTPLIGAESRALRYGDGIFETIRILNGEIMHAELHFSRLFDGIHLLGFELPLVTNTDSLAALILATAKKNNLEKAARIRLALFRGNGGLYDPEHHRPNILVQCWPLPAQTGELNSNGLVLGIYPHARKSCDAISNLKTASHLPYVLAALHAKKMKWNDAVVLNAHSRVSDTSIANLFIIKNKQIITPPLSEGCVAGIMRRFLLRELPQYGFELAQQPLNPADIESADECFLTNAISGIRWVREFQEGRFTNAITKELFEQFVVV